MDAIKLETNYQNEVKLAIQKRRDREKQSALSRMSNEIYSGGRKDNLSVGDSGTVPAGLIQRALQGGGGDDYDGGNGGGSAKEQAVTSAEGSLARASTYFVPRNEIDREVIATDICGYLGNDARVRPGLYGV